MSKKIEDRRSKSYAELREDLLAEVLGRAATGRPEMLFEDMQPKGFAWLLDWPLQTII